MEIWDLSKELGLRKVPDKYTKDGFKYKGVVSTGAFEALSDYGVGLLTLTIRNPRSIDSPIVFLSTIDNGCWSGFGKEFVVIEEIVDDFNTNFGGLKLPTESEFNDFLKDWKIYGCFEG